MSDASNMISFATDLALVNRDGVNLIQEVEEFHSTAHTSRHVARLNTELAFLSLNRNFIGTNEEDGVFLREKCTVDMERYDEGSLEVIAEKWTVSHRCVLAHSGFDNAV